MRRFHLFYVVPTVALLAAAMAPLISGARTLYLRDVLTGHYPLKAVQAELSSQDEVLPLVDPYRAGGQPLLGNPNGLPLYPDNLLYLTASPLWAMNAHFWLHLLLAPFAFYWLARAWGLRPPAAWAAGVVYASSGFVFSLLNLYNLVAGAVLAPAFAAAVLVLWTGETPRRRSAPLVAVLWALLLLAGDPLFALLAVIAAAAAGFARRSPAGRGLPARPGLLAAALACGTLVALPGIVEFLRILPFSLRGYRSYSAASAMLQSWDPRTAVEWFLPLVFGNPDLSFWGQRFYDGLPPLFYSAFPGILALALVLTARGGGRAAVWAWTLVGSGLFLALGHFNPVVRVLYELPGASALRYPVKVWLLVALGGSLLAGIGFERLLHGGGRRRLGRAFGLLAAAYALSWVVVGFTPVGGGLGGERPRVLWLVLLALVFLGLLGGVLWLLRRRPALGGALLLALHLGGQLFFLAPLYDSDDARPYLEEPELLALVPPDARVVHGGFKDLFGEQRVDPARLDLPDPRTFWLTRRHFAELHPFAGVAWGRRYDFNPSPEGLDSFFTFSLAQALERMDDVRRLRVLRGAGVDVLLLDRELDPAARPLVRLLERREGPIYDLYVYQVLDPAGEVEMTTGIRRAPHLNAALAALTDPAFDPKTTVVLPGDGPDVAPGPPGRAEILRQGADEVEVEVDGDAAGVLVVQRTFLPIYRATVDGETVEVLPANLHRLGVEVPPGRHTVRIWADRRPTRFAFAGAVLGLLGVLALARRRTS